MMHTHVVTQHHRGSKRYLESSEPMLPVDTISPEQEVHVTITIQSLPSDTKVSHTILDDMGKGSSYIPRDLIDVSNQDLLYAAIDR